MDQGGINPVQKSLLRASGLALLTVYLIKIINGVGALQPPLQPAALLRLSSELMDYSFLLAIGLLLLLLSLSDQTVVDGDAQSPRQLGLRDGLLVRARTLVGVLALLYLLLIPLTLIQTQTLLNIGDRVMEQKSMALRQKVEEVSRRISEHDDDSLTVASLQQRYPWLIKADVRSLNELQSLLAKTLTKAGPYYNKLRAASRRDLHIQSIRLCLVTAIYSSLIGYLWYRWPRPTTAAEVIHSRHCKELGLECEEFYLDAGVDGADLRSQP